MSDEVEALKFNGEKESNMTSKNKNLPASQTMSAGKDQRVIITNLTERWTGTLGKSAESILETASILADAKAKIADKATYEQWLKEVAKMSEGTASKYRSIDTCTFLHDAEHTAQLPPDWTIYYELSKLRTLALFKKGLAFVVTEIPTHAELANKISELLGKPRSKDTLKRTGKLVTNNQKIVAEVKRQTAKAKQEVEKVKEQVHEARAEVKNLQAKLVTTAYIPSKEEIAEMDFEDDGNEILVENFKKAYLALQLKKKIAALLHAEGYSNIQVIVRQRQAVAGKLKVAA